MGNVSYLYENVINQHQSAAPTEEQRRWSLAKSSLAPWRFLGWWWCFWWSHERTDKSGTKENLIRWGCLLSPPSWLRLAGPQVIITEQFELICSGLGFVGLDIKQALRKGIQREDLWVGTWFSLVLVSLHSDLQLAIKSRQPFTNHELGESFAIRRTQCL